MSHDKAKTNQYYIERRIESKYGITYSSYLMLLGMQDRRCAICRKRSKLVIDHDHKFGRVRGLLCGGCNKAIGLLGDNPQFAESASRYLRQTPPKISIVKAIEPDCDDLERKLDVLFAPKQKELILKRACGAALSKTEREYYSRIIKKRLIAISHPDVYITAQKILAS